MKIICTFLFFGVLSCAQAQNILSYGSTNISKEEFLRAFSKNNTRNKPTEKDYLNYLDLYIRFKLKVNAAYDMKLDTLPYQKTELIDFRNQIANGYLNDEISLKNLVSEAFKRSLLDIHLAHLYIQVNPSDSDSVKAQKLVKEAYNKLQKGFDFKSIASIYSTDSAVRINKGDIGFITVFILPYNLENLAYTTPIGMFSKPYRSKAGFHIFKNLGERKAFGKIRAAQILFAFPPDADNIVKAGIKQKADSVYSALLNGESFTNMVKMHSNDNTTYTTSGEMPEFGVAKFDIPFEQSVFELKTNGAISKPILTSFGYHIVKRIEHIPVNEDPENDSAMTVLRQQVKGDDLRMEVSKKAMLEKMYRVTGFKRSAVKKETLFAAVENFLQSKKLPTVIGISEKTILFSFPKRNVYLEDWLKNLQVEKGVSEPSLKKKLPDLLNQYQEAVTREYYLNYLEDFNADFAAQVNEFKEGNLLFEIMQRNVWDKAAADSVGLKKFFESNKSKYQWEPSVEGILFTCTDSVLAFELKTKIEQNKNEWRNIIIPYEDKVQADSGRFEITQLPVPQKIALIPGMVTNPITNRTDTGNISFVYVVMVHREKTSRNLEEAKGFVLNDYQSYLEEKWIEALKKKYPVKINEAIFQSLWK